MTDKDPVAPNILKPATLAVAAQLEGLDLIAGDRALDDARRLCWMQTHAGCDDDEAQRQVGASVPAIKVATLCNGLTLFEVESLFMEVRLFLWMQNFARLPGTKFGKQFAAHAERAELLEDGGKLQ